MFRHGLLSDLEWVYEVKELWVSGMLRGFGLLKEGSDALAAVGW